MNIGLESPLLNFFNIACHEAKSEFKQLIFFEQIQRYQLEKKNKTEDDKTLKEKEKFLHQYFKNMKNEFEISRNQKATVVNELEIYIKKLINEELNNRDLNSNVNNNLSTNNNLKVENELRIIDSDNPNNNANILKVINEMKELKNNQQELINNVAVLFNLKEEIYKDFERIKNVCGMFQNQFHEMGNKIQECQSRNAIMGKETEKSLIIEDNAMGNLKDVVKDINNKLETVKADIDNLKSKNEILTNTFKSNDKQIEEKLYEKIRLKQKEVSEGFSNQDKKITSMDERFKRKLKEQDEKNIKYNEQYSLINRKVHELTESISKFKMKDFSEEIKKISSEIKENKMKEDERITNVTNILNVKINKVDTQVEFLSKQIDEFKKDNQKFETNIKTVQNKYQDIEKIINDVSNITLNVNDNYEKLTSQNESAMMNISILETTVNSLENNFKNYDFEKMKNNINVMKTDVKNIIHGQFPKFKEDYDKKIGNLDTKFLAKIGDVYKSINSYSQKLDVIGEKVEEKFKSLDVMSDSVQDKLRSINRRVDEKLRSVSNNNSYYSSSKNSNNSNSNQDFMKNLEKLEISQNDYWTSFNEKFQKFVKQVNDKHNYLSSEVKTIKKESEQYSSNEIPPNINKYITNELNKLKTLILSLNSVTISKNDPNYITLQSFLTEVLSNHWAKFEKDWKKEFYQCVEEINKAFNKHMISSPININIPK